MKRSFIAGIFFLVPIILAIVFVSTPWNLGSTTALALGTATAEDCARVKLRNPTVVCEPGVTPFTEADASGFGKSTCDFPGDSKAYLQARNNNTPGDVQGLAENFACCLAKFVQAGESAGHSIKVGSGYRSVARQEVLFDAAVRKYGSVAAARRYVAPPGRSNHQSGTAVDLSPFPRGCGTAACRWGHANANNFGLYFRMSWEPWHIEPAPSGSCIGGVQDTTTADNQSSGQTDPPQSPYQQPTAEDLAQGLGIGSGTSPGSGGTSANLNTDSFNSAYEPFSYGGDLGPGENNDFLGDGAPVFEELFGNFGEYGEGEQIRDVLGYDPSDAQATTTPRYSILSSTSTPSSLSECKNGVETRNIYGNIICIRDNTRDIDTSNGEDFFGRDGLISTTVNDGRVSKTIASLMNYVLPIRHLLGDGMSGNSQDTGIVGGNSFEAYDVYRPTEGIARGNDDRPGLQAEDIIAWMIQNDLIEEGDETQYLTISVLLGLLRPILMYISLVLFGTGTHAVNTALDLANNI